MPPEPASGGYNREAGVGLPTPLFKRVCQTPELWRFEKIVRFKPLKGANVEHTDCENFPR